MISKFDTLTYSKNASSLMRMKDLWKLQKEARFT